jgi:hypothetical protein
MPAMIVLDGLDCSEGAKQKTPRPAVGNTVGFKKWLPASSIAENEGETLGSPQGTGSLSFRFA